MKIKNKFRSIFFPIFFSIFFVAISSCQKDDSIYDSPVTAPVDSLNTQGKTPAGSLIHQDSIVNPGNSSEAVSDTVTAPAASETVTSPASNEQEANVPVETGSTDTNTDEPAVNVPEETTTGSQDISNSFPQTTNPETPAVLNPPTSTNSDENDNAEAGATGSYVEAPVTTPPATSTPSAPVQQSSGTTANNPVPDISSDPFPSTNTPSTPSVVTSTEPEPSVSGHNIINDLPKGYVKDGSVDYTSYIQAAINKYKEIVFPGFPIMINDNGLLIKSDRKITFMEGSVIKMKPTSSGSYRMFNIKHVSNVTLINPVIIGDRQKHLGNSGESGIGISITDVTGVKIYNPKISYTWGDGIYIGKGTKDVEIYKAYISKVSRNGISIVSGINVTLVSPYIEYTDRTAPMAGIDIEPDASTNDLQGIKILNPITYKNTTSGIQIGLSEFYYDNADPKKQISIEIDNHQEEGARYGVWLATGAKGTYKDMGTVVAGTIKFVNPVWKANDLAIKAATLIEPNIAFTLDKATIIDSKGRVYSKNQLESLFDNNIGEGVTKSIIY